MRYFDIRIHNVVRGSASATAAAGNVGFGFGRSGSRTPAIGGRFLNLAISRRTNFRTIPGYACSTHAHLRGCELHVCPNPRRDSRGGPGGSVSP